MTQPEKSDTIAARHLAIGDFLGVQPGVFFEIVGLELHVRLAHADRSLVLDPERQVNVDVATR